MTVRVVPGFDLLTVVHLLDGPVFDPPCCPVPYYPPLDDAQWIEVLGRPPAAGEPVQR